MARFIEIDKEVCVWMNCDEVYRLHVGGENDTWHVFVNDRPVNPTYTSQEEACTGLKELKDRLERCRD